jgi:uncharacterized protein YqcC (DUF446 family)
MRGLGRVVSRHRQRRHQLQQRLQHHDRQPQQQQQQACLSAQQPASLHALLPHDLQWLLRRLPRLSLPLLLFETFAPR